MKYFNSLSNVSKKNTLGEKADVYREQMIGNIILF